MNKPGYKLTSIITTIRHGEKDINGNLTETGGKQSEQKGLLTKGLKGNIILFHSGSQRVMDTLKNFVKYINVESDQENISIDKNVKYISYETPLLNYLYSKDHPSEYFNNWDRQGKSLGVENRNRSFIEQGKDSFEPQKFPGPILMAKRLSKLLLTQIELSLVTKPDDKINFVNGTHEPVLLSFLHHFYYKFLNQTSKIDYTIYYASGFDIFIYQNDSLDYFLEIEYKDNRLPFNLEDLRNFVQEL